MNPFHRLGRLALILTVLALVVAACGDGTSEEPLGTVGDTDVVPPTEEPCLPGEPDCEEPPAGAGTLPAPDDGAAISSGMPANGGLTVSEALETDATGIIAVQGFFFDDGSGPRLCEALVESFPPQCGMASLPVSDHEDVITVPLVNEQNVIWSDTAITLFGEIVDGVLVVDPTVTG